MYPCCIPILIILLHYWGAKEKAAAVWRYIKTRWGRTSAKGDILQKPLRQTLEEIQQEYSVIKKTREGYTDGRTKIIDLRENGAGRPGDKEAQA